MPINVDGSPHEPTTKNKNELNLKKKITLLRPSPISAPASAISCRRRGNGKDTTRAPTPSGATQCTPKPGKPALSLALASRRYLPEELVHCGSGPRGRSRRECQRDRRTGARPLPAYRPSGSAVVRYALRIAAAEPPQREPIHFVSNAMSSKLGQLFRFRCPSHRGGSRRRNISQVANSLHLYLKRVASLYKHFLCVYHFAQTTGSTLTKIEKKKEELSVRATLQVYVYMLMFHVHLSRHFFVRLGVA